MVDFGSVQLDRRSPRHRVIATNPLGNQVVCVRIMPFVAAAEKSIAEIEGDVDAATISAANLHVAGEYDPPGATGFVLEGGDISMKRKTGKGKGAAALVSDGRDTACLEPGESVDLGLLSFKPNEVRKYHAHMCVRNNFTTLECATLSGSADAVKVYVAKKPRGTQVVTDVGFRLARIGLGGADLLTQTVHVVNRGSVAVEVAKPYVGAFACGGDGSVGGYTVQPCKPFTLPPGGSKQLTVACFTDKAAQAAKYARGVAGVWTALTMEVSSPDGVKLRHRHFTRRMGLSPERTRLARWRDRDPGRSSRGWRRYARAVPRAGSSTPTVPRSRVRTNDARRRPRRRLLRGRRRLWRLSQPRLSRPTAKRRRGAGRRTSEAPRPRARPRAEVPSLRSFHPRWTPSPAPVPARRRLSRSSRRLPSRKPPAWTPPPVPLRHYPPRSPRQNSETRRAGGGEV